jgi:uncharacterized protein (DUF1800 family)
MNTTEIINSDLSTEKTTITEAPATSAIQAVAVSTAVAGVAALATEQAHAAVAITSTSKPNEHDAWRFLTQATFGPSKADLLTTATLKNKGYVAWLNEQFLKQPKDTTYNLSIKNRYCAAPFAAINKTRFEVGAETTSSAIWEQFLTGPDQLRQRVAFALSEILVVSMRDGFTLRSRTLSVASYHDLLAKNAFGSFRTLIKDVCRHPAMGDFLSHLGNHGPVFLPVPQGDDGRVPTRQIPDQNFARELMQLFTIGLVKLNIDGTPALDAQGQVKETYSQKDIEILSYVFTGWYWDFKATNSVSVTAFQADPAVIADDTALPVDANLTDRFDRNIRDFWPPMSRLMVAKSDEHASIDDYLKGFGNGPLELLGKPFVPTGTAMGDLDAALKILLDHQNVAPFIARQMIQRLVTSDPSRAYVQRVATQFKASNLSMKTLVQAILLDTEARDVARINSTSAFALSYGKLREPVLRITAALRALGFNAHRHLDTNVNKDCYIIPLTYMAMSTKSDPDEQKWQSTTTLGQGPYQAPSVFNFFRPGYVVPGTLINAPEFQASTGVELTAYIDFVEAMVEIGGCGYYYWGGEPLPAPISAVNQLIPEDLAESPIYRRDVRMGVYYKLNDELEAIAADAAAAPSGEFTNLLNKLSYKFCGGAMSTGPAGLTGLRGKLKKVLRDRFGTNGEDLASSTPYSRSVAIKQCLLLVLVAPEFVVQR